MCIIIYKPKGQDFPKKEVLEECFFNNPDGAGIMYYLQGRVKIKKGFMEYCKLEEYLEKLEKKLNIKDIPMAIHCRIATSGLVDGGNTHPFPITKKERDLRKLTFTCDAAVMHNGIISGLGNKLYSDTQEFILKYLSELPLQLLAKGSIKKLIEKAIDKSRMLIFDLNEKIYMLGNWIEDKGIFYSNNSYKPKTYFGYYSLWSGWNDKKDKPKKLGSYFKHL